MKNVSIKVKLLVPIITLVVLLYVATVVGILGSRALKSISDEIGYCSAQNISTLGELSKDYETIQKIAFAHVVCEDDQKIGGLIKEYKETIADLTEKNANLRRKHRSRT